MVYLSVTKLTTSLELDTVEDEDDANEELEEDLLRDAVTSSVRLLLHSSSC
jgi:hypothetical protein